MVRHFIGWTLHRKGYGLRGTNQEKKRARKVLQPSNANIYFKTTFPQKKIWIEL